MTAVRVQAAGVVLDGDLEVPEGATGLVVFAHGSGSSRHSPRNRQVAEDLRGAKLATLLLDLLTPDEERVDVLTREFRFDVDLLGTRVASAVDAVDAVDAVAAVSAVANVGAGSGAGSGAGAGAGAAGWPQVAGLPVGLFGASTGAAAALIAAARNDRVAAVVSRGGRPDLAMPVLAQVRAPTLLIVGGADPVVLDLNRKAARQLGGDVRVEIVPGATHLFEEPGALEQVCRLAADWFGRALAR